MRTSEEITKDLNKIDQDIAATNKEIDYYTRFDDQEELSALYGELSDLKRQKEILEYELSKTEKR